MSNTSNQEVHDSGVNDVTDALNKTSINDGKDENKDAVHASVEEGCRLYIGNLAYATTEEELKEFFNGYTIETASIPKNPRTERPVGYAFVDLATAVEAERAIVDLSGKEILERKVSVQLARTPTAAGEKHAAGSKGDKGEGQEHSGRRTSGRGRGRGRTGRSGRSGRHDNNKDGNHDGGVTGENEGAFGDADQHPLTDITNSNKSNADGYKNKDKPRQPREKRERGPPADGVPSKTKVMVANLPYDLTEDKLKELFNDYQPSSAKIALRPIPRFMIKKLQARGEARKGRGFGFVTLASEELQNTAVAEMNGKEIDGREIAVKVAIDSPDKTDDDIVNGENDSPIKSDTNGEQEVASATD